MLIDVRRNIGRTTVICFLFPHPRIFFKASGDSHFLSEEECERGFRREYASLHLKQGISFFLGASVGMWSWCCGADAPLKNAKELVKNLLLFQELAHIEFDYEDVAVNANANANIVFAVERAASKEWVIECMVTHYFVSLFPAKRENPFLGFFYPWIEKPPEARVRVSFS